MDALLLTIKEAIAVEIEDEAALEAFEKAYAESVDRIKAAILRFKEGV